MKNVKKRKYLSIILLFLVLPMTSFWLNVSFTSASETSEEDTPETPYTSHSSPYFFRVNKSSPLLNDNEDEEKDLPQSSYRYSEHQDYALTLYLDKYAITPDETVNLNLRLTEDFLAKAGEYVTIRIYKGFYRYYYYYYPEFYDAELLFDEYRITDAKGEISLSFSDTSDPGSYTIFASYDDNYVNAYREFSVSNTGVFLKGSKYYMENQEYHAAVHLVNMSDFTPAANQNYTYSIETYDYDYDQWIPLYSGEEQTDGNGYDVFHTDPIIVSDNSYFWSALRLTVESEDGISYSTFLYKDWSHYYYTLWGGQQESNHDKYQFVVTSDKTIYSPGEIIKLRTLVFEYTYLNETRVPYSNQELQLAIFNPSELAVFWTTIPTNAEGVALIEFPLDYESEIGLFNFEFSIDQISYTHSIRVDYYEKPVFRVEIDTNGKEFYPRSSDKLGKILFEGFVNVEYYFGQPVVDADVELVIKTYWDDETVTIISGKTNGEGRLKFSINLRKLDDVDWAFIAEASVTDTYGRSAETRKKYTRSNELLAYGYLANWAPLPDEPSEYYFNVYQILSQGDGYWGYEYNPLANVTAEIEIFGVRSYPVIVTTIMDRTLLESYTAVTNDYGSGKIEFSLPLSEIKSYHLFEVRLNVELEDGRSTTWSTYYRYKKYKLDIEIADSEINQGETLEFTASYVDALTGDAQEGEGRIYIYDSEYHLLGRSGFEINGALDFELIIPDFAPDGTYYLSSYVFSRSNEYYGGFYYHSAYLQFSVGTVTEIDFTTNATGGNDYAITVAIGDTIEIQGTTNVSSNQPYYFEIYKRGLLHSEELNVVSDQFTKELNITSELGPDFTIMVYTISNSGQLFEKYIVVHIEYQSGFTIQTDKEIYEPGDTITLTVLPNDDNPVLLSTTFTDSSVLAIEPEDDSELAFFDRTCYRAYIGSGSSWGTGVYWENYAWINYEVQSGGFYNNYYRAELDYGGYEEFDAISDVPNQGPSITDVINSYDVNVRDNITESANWIPSSIISGPTNFTFQLPDNIGGWTIRIVGNAIDESNILWGDVQTVEIKAFLPFFVEFEPPKNTDQDEIVTLKAYVYNYAGRNLVTDVFLQADGFDILNNPMQNVLVPQDYVSEIEYTLFARDPYLQNITVVAIGDEGAFTDAKQMQTYIHPTGYEITNRTSIFLNESISPYLMDYTVGAASIYHQETLTFYSDVIDISLEGWERLIGYPYGCVEQTSSKLVSTALVYHNLNQTGQLTEDLRFELTPMIIQGVNRLYSMQNDDGGWGWWSDQESNIQMATLAVFTLQQVELAGFLLNAHIMSDAYDFIVSSQNPDGSWMYPYYSANDFEATIYTLRTLINAADKTTEVEVAIQSGLNFLSVDWLNEDHQSSYGAALYLIATMNTTYENLDFNDDMLAYLMMERKSGSGTVYWDNGDSYYWSNLGNKVEITAYATLALAMEDYLGNYAIIQKAVKYLLDSKSAWGWWSTADSSAAIYTLTEIEQLGGSSPVLDFNGTVNITINSATSPQIILNLTDSAYNPSAFLTQISGYLEVGENDINITVSGTGQLAMIFESTQLVRYIPSVSIPEIINLGPDQLFNLTVELDPIYQDLQLSEVTLSLVDLPEDFVEPGEDYTKQITWIPDYSQVNFTLRAPSTPGEYSLEGVISSMLLVLNSDVDSGIAYQKMMGPVSVRVDLDFAPSSSTFASKSYTGSSYGSPLPSSTLSTGLSVHKQLSKTGDLLPGDLITVSVDITNVNSSKQYYTLDDFIPTGMVLAEESIRINGQTVDENILDVTYQSTSSAMHFFIPLVPNGITTITYNLLVNSVKNSVAPSSKLWGMYENITITSYPIVIMNIPVKYYANQSIYRDLIDPEISALSLSQINDVRDMQLLLEVDAIDNNHIQKLRLVFKQGTSWRSQSVFFSKGSNTFDTLISGLDNVDSEVTYFVEIQDEYGNVIRSSIQTMKVHSTRIAYIMLVIGLSLAAGVASVAAYVYKKKGRQGSIEGVSFSEDAEPDEIELDSDSQ